MTEPDFRTRRAKHVVYGHTHAAEITPLDASHAEGYVLDQIYFNSGTWRRTYNSANFAPAGHEFIATDVFSTSRSSKEMSARGEPSRAGPARSAIRRRNGKSIALMPVAACSATSPEAPHFVNLLGNTSSMAARTES